MTHRNQLEAARTVLLVVDLQERFRSVISDFDEIVARSARLIRTFRILDLPIVVTEQYPKGLGPTVVEVREALSFPGAPEVPVLEKTVFSACGAAGIRKKLPDSSGLGVLVCGIEAHVCVNQSVHDLLEAGQAVHVAVDAVGSRRESDREVALRKMERSGAVLTTSEMAAFELLADARHLRFKEVQALYK